MIVMIVYLFVCLTDYLPACLSNHTSTNFSVHVACGRGSVLLRRRCDTLCTWGFLDDITFSYWPYGGVTLLQCKP